VSTRKCHEFGNSLNQAQIKVANFFDPEPAKAFYHDKQDPSVVAHRATLSGRHVAEFVKALACDEFHLAQISDFLYAGDIGMKHRNEQWRHKNSSLLKLKN
jgi:hypothetical protein